MKNSQSPKAIHAMSSLLALCLAAPFPLAAGSVTFTRDAAGRLTAANYSNGNAHGYTFDAAGNLTKGTATAPGGVINPDSDGDGLPDAWEQQYFGTLARNGTGDFDSDGFLDAAEYAAGTLPNNAGSALRLFPNPAVSGGGVTVQWEAVPGKTYRLVYKNSLNDLNWTPVPGDIPAGSTTALKSDTSAAGQPARLYQVQLMP